MLKRLKDPVSGLTHLVGAILGVIGMVYLIRRSLHSGSAALPISLSIFGTSLVLLYLSSALYHLLDVSDRARRVFRQLDHSMIFVLIAGSYTPFCMVTLRGVVGWNLLAAVWGLAVAGLLVKIFWRRPPRWLSTGIYLLLGWMVIVVIYPLSRALSLPGLTWLIIGGLCYTVGAVIYALKRPDPFPPVFGFHEIWHLLVLAGSVSHYLSVATLVG